MLEKELAQIALSSCVVVIKVFYQELSFRILTVFLSGVVIPDLSQFLSTVTHINNRQLSC